jgi:pimeloyl-ACP methyl ester carboxylesterase
MTTTAMTTALATIALSLAAAACGTSDTGTADAEPTPTSDAVATTKPVERWASLSPASTVVSVRDTGHTIQLDQPALVIEEIAGLLEGTP